jgi:tetratricopeptide (TPR) repeat protein
VDTNVVSAHAHYIQGMMNDLDEQPEEALAELSQAAKDDPANEDLVLELSRRYLQLREPEKALDLLMRATAVPGASGAIVARLGRVESRLGKDDEAIKASETAVKRSPLLLAGYENLFLINLQKGRVGPALAVLQEASKQSEASQGFLVDLSELYAALERQAPSEHKAAEAGARDALERAAAMESDDPHLQLRLADGFNALGDATNAIPIYEMLVDRFHEVPALQEDVRSKLTDLYLRQHNVDKAREQLEATVDQDPANAQAYFVLGSLACDARKMPEAEEYFKKALLLADDREWYYELAEVQIDQDHAKDALATLAKAGAKYAQTFEGEFLTALAYSREQDYTNAVNHYTSAELLGRASDPKRLDDYFYFQEGAAYERKGDYADSEAAFDKALLLAPDAAETLNYLGYMLADRGVKLEHAHELIAKAVRLEPKNAAYLDSLGWVLYKLNQPADALPQELKAIELSPEPDAILFDHLGDIYAALKQTDKARESWRKSLALEPNPQIKKKLDADPPH